MKEMNVSEAIKYRRSVRVFDDKNIDSIKVKDCLVNATLAANSSNLQLWEFVHVENKKILGHEIIDNKNASRVLRISDQSSYFISNFCPERFMECTGINIYKTVNKAYDN